MVTIEGRVLGENRTVQAEVECFYCGRMISDETFKNSRTCNCEISYISDARVKSVSFQIVPFEVNSCCDENITKNLENTLNTIKRAKRKNWDIETLSKSEIKITKEFDKMPVSKFRKDFLN